MSVRQEIKCGCTWLQACVERERERKTFIYYVLWRITRVWKSYLYHMNHMRIRYFRYLHKILHEVFRKKKYIRMGDWRDILACPGSIVMLSSEGSLELMMTWPTHSSTQIFLTKRAALDNPVARCSTKREDSKRTTFGHWGTICF